MVLARGCGLCRGVLARLMAKRPASGACAGNYHYLLQIEVADLPAYEDFHANRLASLPGVAMVNSYATMKTLSADPRDQLNQRRLERPGLARCVTPLRELSCPVFL